MSILHFAYQHRQAIDNRLNRDLIARARLQGFVFSKPFEDAETWLELETAKPEDPTAWCDPAKTDWLFVKAIEATLFLIYYQNCRVSRH